MVKVKALIFMGLLLGLIASAIAVIYFKYNARLMFIEIQKQEAALDQYEVEWGQLQLELTTLTEENQLEQVARDKLKLIVPQRDKIIYIKP